MWDEFSDFELAELVGRHGMADMIEFNEDMRLTNRARLEQYMTEIEHDLAFGE